MQENLGWIQNSIRWYGVLQNSLTHIKWCIKDSVKHAFYAKIVNDYISLTL